jgi:hypothetical protein
MGQSIPSIGDRVVNSEIIVIPRVQGRFAPACESKGKGRPKICRQPPVLLPRWALIFPLPTRFLAAFDLLVLRASRVRLRWLLCIVLAGVVIQGFWVNADVLRTDQSAFIAYGKTLFDSGYSFVGDRCRMPLFPVLVSACGWLGVNDWFDGGKAVAGAVAAMVAFGMFVWFRARFGRREGAVVWIALWGPALALRTFYVECDVLACGLVLLAWGLVRKPDAGLWQVALAGLATGAAYMAKASMIPFFAIVVVMLAAGSGRARWAMGLARSAVYSICALLPVWRYLESSRALYGHWFYNVNSTFYFWYDSWAEIARGTRAFGDRVGWPRMPAEDIPSLHWYLSRHGTGDVAARLVEGGLIQAGVLLVFCGLALWLRPMSRIRTGAALTAAERAVILMVLVYFVLTSWWMALGIGSRFMLPIVLIGVVELWARVRAAFDSERLYGSAVIWILSVWPFLALFSHAGE